MKMSVYVSEEFMYLLAHHILTLRPRFLRTRSQNIEMTKPCKSRNWIRVHMEDKAEFLS